jgi:ribosomal-protein-alanine N-acetyltransferase
MTPLIRPMAHEDIEHIVLLDREILGQSLGEATFAAELVDNPFNRYFVMTDDFGAILGHIGLWLDPPLAQILNFYIVPKHQQNGYGTRLFAFALEECIRRQVDTVTLEVRPTNANAIRFYQRFGFAKVSVRKQYYADGEDADLMLLNV